MDGFVCENMSYVNTHTHYFRVNFRTLRRTRSMMWRRCVLAELFDRSLYWIILQIYIVFSSAALFPKSDDWSSNGRQSHTPHMPLFYFIFSFFLSAINFSVLSPLVRNQNEASPQTTRIGPLVTFVLRHFPFFFYRDCSVNLSSSVPPFCFATLLYIIRSV